MRVIGQMGSDEDPTIVLDLDGEKLVLATLRDVGEPIDGSRWMKFQGGYVEKVTAPTEVVDTIYELAIDKLL